MPRKGAEHRGRKPMTLDEMIRGLSDVALRIMLSDPHRGCRCRVELLVAERDRRAAISGGTG